MASGGGEPVVGGDGFYKLRQAAGIADPGPLLERIGAQLVSNTRRGFQQQKRRAAWSPRMVPNIPGIIEDLRGGTKIQARRMKPRPALIDTGRLESSIAYKTSKSGGGGSGAYAVRGWVEFGTNVPYGAVHQFGKRVTVRVDRRVKENLRALWDRAKRSRSGPDSVLPDGLTWKQLGFLFKVDQISVKVRKRQFIAVTREDLRDIEAIIADYQEELAGGE